MPPIHRIVRDMPIVDSHRFKVAVRGDDFAALAVETERGEVGFAFGFADELEDEGVVVVPAQDAPVGVVVADDFREIEFVARGELEIANNFGVGDEFVFHETNLDVGIGLHEIVQAHRSRLRHFAVGNLNRCGKEFFGLEGEGRGLNRELDAFGDVVGERGRDGGDERCGETFGVFEDFFFLRGLERTKNLVERGARQARLFCRAVEEIENGIRALFLFGGADARCAFADNVVQRLLAVENRVRAERDGFCKFVHTRHFVIAQAFVVHQLRKRFASVHAGQWLFVFFAGGAYAFDDEVSGIFDHVREPNRVRGLIESALFDDDDGLRNFGGVETFHTFGDERGVVNVNLVRRAAQEFLDKFLYARVVENFVVAARGRFFCVAHGDALFCARVAVFFLQAVRERAVTFVGDDGEDVKAFVVQAFALLIHGQAQAASNFLAAARFGDGLIERTDLENVRIVPALFERGMGKDKTNGLLEREQTFLVLHDQLVRFLFRFAVGFRFVVFFNRRLDNFLSRFCFLARKIRAAHVRGFEFRKRIAHVFEPIEFLVKEDANDSFVVRVIGDAVNEKEREDFDALCAQPLLRFEMLANRLADLDAENVVLVRGGRDARVVTVAAFKFYIAARRVNFRNAKAVLKVGMLDEGVEVARLFERDRFVGDGHAHERGDRVNRNVLDAQRLLIRIALFGHAPHFDLFHEPLAKRFKGREPIDEIAEAFVRRAVAEREQRIERA